jgi:hypothetical protein
MRNRRENNSLALPCYYGKHSQLYGRTYEGGLLTAAGVDFVTAVMKSPQ